MASAGGFPAWWGSGMHQNQWKAMQDRAARNPAHQARATAAKRHRPERSALERRVAVLERGKEHKFHDVTISATPSVTGMTLLAHLNIIAAGDGGNQRTGRKISVEKVQLHLLLTRSVASPTSDPCTARIAIIQDRQTNGAQFAAADLMEQDSLSGFRNLENRNRFKVLFSQVVDLTSVAYPVSTDVVYQGPSQRFVEAFIKFKRAQQAEYSSTTGVVGEQTSNSFWVVCWVTDADTCTISGYARVRFTDN